MAPKTSDQQHTLALPVSVTGPVDIGRLIRELEMIDDALLQQGIRSKDEEVRIPTTTRLLDRLVETNGLNLLQQEDRARLRQFLNGVKQRSPVLHISFSADPSRAFLEKLMDWLRQEIHPWLLLTIGLQPNIGAGCIVRTMNKQFDLSLRQDFLNKRQLLLEQLAAPPVAPAPEPVKEPSEGMA